MPRHTDDRKKRLQDSDEGSAIGLTRAFSPIGDDFDALFDDAPANPSAFDAQDVPDDAPDVASGVAPEAASDAAFGDRDALSARQGSLGASEVSDELAAEGKRTRAGEAAPSADLPAPPAPADVDPLTEEDLSFAAKRGRHARRASPAASGQASEGAGHAAASGADEAARKEVPAYLHKSRRMRRVLIGVIVVLVLLLAAGAFFAWQLVQTNQQAATQQAQSTTQDSDVLGTDDPSKDASSSTVKKTTVPNLVSLLGMTQDQAVEALQHGAQVSSVREVNEEGNPIKADVRVALTAEPADTRSGTPTVYLGLNEEGVIIQAGYSAATSSLGYGSLSFSDAVRNENIVEKTLAEAGISVAQGTVTLPEDKMEYSTYASDGTTLTKEYCSFSGDVDIDGTPHTWSSVLSYDYSMANATGNLADTIRTIYIYINA